MDLPVPLQHLIEQMGAAVMMAVSDNPRCRELAVEIQKYGWDVALQVEATVSLHPRQTEPDPQPSGSFSEADRAFLHTFRIRLD